MCPVQNVIAPASAVPGRAAGATDFLDGWRGLAALEVVICHLFALTMASKLFAPPPGSSDVLCRAAFYILAAPFRFGVAAVWFFFVLSGFVIHLRYAKALRENPAAKFGWRKFVWHRLRRLYPPLLLAIGATWALVNLGTRMHLQFFDWGGAQWMPVLPSVFTCNLTLVGNLLFLMGCYMPAYGTDGSLWSLNREWWFYMLYPLLSPVLRLGKSPWLATAVVAGLYLFSFRINNPLLKLPKCIFHDMALWWLGALLAEIYAGRTRVSFAQIAPLATFIPIAMVFALLHQTGLIRSASLGQDGDIGQAMFGSGFRRAYCHGLLGSTAIFLVAVCQAQVAWGNVVYALCHSSSHRHVRLRHCSAMAGTPCDLAAACDDAGHSCVDSCDSLFPALICGAALPG